MTTHAASLPPAAFLSYVHDDDDFEQGRITQLCAWLTGEVRFQLGSNDFDIFQDKSSIPYGAQWRARIRDTLHTATFLIPIVTPRYFTSAACLAELKDFLAYEAKIPARRIMSIYYSRCDQIEDQGIRDRDPLARVIS